MAEHKVLYLSRSDVETVNLPMKQIIDLLEKGNGRVEMPPKPGRQDEKERILAINLGLAMDDMAVAPTIYDCAKKQGLGTWLPL